jgi:hypothetical protein
MTRAQQAVWALRLVAVAPAVVALLWILEWASSAPEPIAWRSQLGDGPLCFAWRQVTEFTGEPNFLVFRLLHSSLLAVPGLDFPHLPLTTWAIAAATCLLLRRQLHSTAAARTPAWLAPAVLGYATLWCFSPAFGANWLLGERLRLFLPALCCLLAVWLLAARAAGRWRILTAAVLAQAALFSERTGFLVWIALVPLLWTEATRRHDPRRLFDCAWWCLLGNASTWIALDERPPTTAAHTGLVGDLLVHPGTTLAHLVRTVGRSLPDLFAGPDLDELVLGAALVAALVTLLVRLYSVRYDGERLHQAMPWVSLALFGIGHALVVGEFYNPPPLTPMLMREVLWGSWLLPIGLVGLGLVTMTRSARRLLALAVPVLGLLCIQDWQRGFGHLALEHQLLRQGEALSVFVPAANSELPEGAPLPLPPGEVVALRERGKLRRLAATTGMDLAQLDLEPQPGHGALESATTTAALGRVGDQDGFVADLVLVVRAGASHAQSGQRIVRIAVPAPSTSREPRPWSAELGELEAFTAGDTLQAFVFDGRGRRVRPLAGVVRFNGAHFEPAPEAGAGR